MALMKSGQRLRIGDNSPEFNLTGVDEREYSLDDFKDKKALLVIFMCNHCPYVKAKIDAIKKLQEDFKDELQVVGINSNDPDDYPEDSFANMKKYAKEGKYNFIYFFDESQEVARAYGASCTPDPFLFKNENGEWRLYYHGRINNAMEPSDKVTSNDMHEAIRALLDDEEYDREVFPSIGCSIKWKKDGP